MANRKKEQDMPLELTDQQLEKVDGGMEAGNLPFAGKTTGSSETVQKRPAPKEGGLVHKDGT